MEKLRIAIPGRESQTKNYFAALRALDAEPVLAGMDCDPADYDGLLLPGGVDVEPWRFGQENRGSLSMDAELDALQFTVLDAFVGAGKPVFGICRGHQVINIYFGGTLIQHLPTSDSHTQDTFQNDRVHLTVAEPGSFLSDLYGTQFFTNSSHHQATDRPGVGLRTVQYAMDGTVEGACHESLPVWSVQWHPERMCFGFRREDTVDGEPVLRFFLEQCLSHR